MTSFTFPYILTEIVDASFTEKETVYTQSFNVIPEELYFC